MNPERVSGVKKTVRRTVFSREVRDGHRCPATVGEDARICEAKTYPFRRANKKGTPSGVLFLFCVEERDLNSEGSEAIKIPSGVP